MKIGSILKLETGGSGLIFYRITSDNDTSYGIKPLCKIRKGFLTVKYEDALESHVYKSEIGVNYLAASKREIEKIKKILTDTFREIDDK